MSPFDYIYGESLDFQTDLSDFSSMYGIAQLTTIYFLTTGACVTRI